MGSNVVTDDSTSTSLDDYKLKGMHMRIGVAVSQDGKTWGRVEGDDPTGACMVPYDKTDPDTKQTGEQSGFFMYYSTMTKDTKEKCLAVAVSSDGFRWLKRGLCLAPSTDKGSFDDGGVARCNVVRNASYNADQQTWYDEPGY